LRQTRLHARDVPPHDACHLAGVDPPLDIAAVESTIALDIETVGAAGNGSVVVDSATASVAVEKRADRSGFFQNAPRDFLLNAGGQARQSVFQQLPLGAGQARRFGKAPAAVIAALAAGPIAV
jgi:hypothetical protein